MTSSERREARYQRRKASREEKRNRDVDGALDFDDVVTFMHLYRSAEKCFRGVSWKASVQAYKCKTGINVAKKFLKLKNGDFRQRKCPEFVIHERGHARRINSINIDDRVAHKCVCKYALKPVLHRGLIYDNYASQEGKGTYKARQRNKAMLEKHIRKYGMEGGVIIFDFRKFFDSIRHDLIRGVLEKNFDDQRITDINMAIVGTCRKDVGIVLGSENSQDFAIAVPNAFDHYIKEVLHVEGYGRYMDDGLIIDPDYEHLKMVYRKIKEYAASIGLTLSEKKCRLLHFGQPFTFLQRKYSFTKTGGIIIRPSRTSVVRERRKLKRLCRRVNNGTLPAQTGYNSLNAWKASIKGCRCTKIVRSIEQLYNKLFIYDWLYGQEV